MSPHVRRVCTAGRPFSRPGSGCAATWLQGLFCNMRLQGEHFRGSRLGWARLGKADSMVASAIKLGSGRGGPWPHSLFLVVSLHQRPQGTQGPSAPGVSEPQVDPGLVAVGSAGRGGLVTSPCPGQASSAWAGWVAPVHRDLLTLLITGPPGQHLRSRMGCRTPGPLTPQEPVCCPWFGGGSGGVDGHTPTRGPQQRMGAARRPRAHSAFEAGVHGGGPGVCWEGLPFRR